MSKQLKDYLHLHLGCECKMIKPSYHAVHELHLSSDRTFILTGKLYDYFSSDTTKAEIKPILRPLSDMTDEEKKEIDKQYKAFTKSKTFDDTGVVMWSAKHTQILLSKHFDLFGLIDAGLAIDKTKQTVEK